METEDSGTPSYAQHHAFFHSLLFRAKITEFSFITAFVFLHFPFSIFHFPFSIFPSHTMPITSPCGLLSVRQGGLNNLGFINPATIQTDFFDCDVLAVIQKLPYFLLNNKNAISIEGSIGDSFRMDWNDGSFSETNTATKLYHSYTRPLDDYYDGVKLTLTASTNDGKKHVVSSTIPICESNPTLGWAGMTILSSRKPTPQSQGHNCAYTPATIQVDVRGEHSATHFIYDWGDGTRTGPMKSITAEHSYRNHAEYQITIIPCFAQSETYGYPYYLKFQSLIDPIDLSPYAYYINVDWERIWEEKYKHVPAKIRVEARYPYGDDLRFIYDLGDGYTIGPTTDTFVEYTYDEVGEYTVYVTASDPFGQSKKCFAGTIEVRPKWVEVSVDLTNDRGPRPLTVNAIVTAKHAQTYTFDWGDGSQTYTTNTPNATHTYYSEGRMVLQVTATSDENTSANAWMTIYVLPPLPPPRAMLSISPSFGDSPLSVEAIFTGSTADSREINWGDGVIEFFANWVESATHIYNVPGNYTITFVVTNEQNVPDGTTAQVRVLDPSELRAILNMYPSSGYAPLTVLADASESNGSDFAFILGDGNEIPPQMEKEVIHTYEIPGYYSVILSVRKDGMTKTAKKGVAVSPSPLVQTEHPIPSVLGPVELESRIRYNGIARGNFPSKYRIALAQGKCYLNDALQLNG
ncbi:MAG: PKD domain-containing protein, partial [Thermoguttaceae bacterium]